MDWRQRKLGEKAKYVWLKNTMYSGYNITQKWNKNKALHNQLAFLCTSCSGTTSFNLELNGCLPPSSIKGNHAQPSASFYPSLFRCWKQTHNVWMAEPIPHFSHIHFPLVRFLHWKWKFSMESWNKKLISMASYDHDAQTVWRSWKTFSHRTKMCFRGPVTLIVMSWGCMSQEYFW